MANLLEINNIVKDYSSSSETLHILKKLDLIIEYGDKISITGESGSGKSTLLNLIGGLDSVTSGSIKFEGIEITSLDENEITFFRNKKVGFIFQSHYLLEEFTALENVLIPYLISDYNKKRAVEKAVELLNYIDMSDRLNHYPSQLSGGEKQRVAIARAFINNPSLILADEPTGNLDEKNAAKVLKLLLSIANKKNHALILVSHSKHITKLMEKNYHLEKGKLAKI